MYIESCKELQVVQIQNGLVGIVLSCFDFAVNWPVNAVMQKFHRRLISSDVSELVMPFSYFLKYIKKWHKNAVNDNDNNDNNILIFDGITYQYAQYCYQ